MAVAIPTYDEGLSLLTEAAIRGGPGSGCSEAELAEAERRLGRPLPQVLRTFHARLGKLPLVMRSHDRVIPLEDLRLDADELTFCREHQDQMRWAVRAKDLDQDDPPVFQRQPGTDEWFDQQADLSLFLVTESAWQVVNGLPSTAVCELEVGVNKRLRSTMVLAAFSLGYGQTCLVDPEQGIVALSLSDPQKVYFGAHDDDSLERLETTADIELDWF